MVEVWVNAMTCAHCEQAISTGLRAVPGVRSLSVDAATGRVAIEADPDLDRRAVAAAIDDAGFTLVRSNLEMR